MYKNLKGKTALITGAGKRTGIGYAICAKLASCGSNVIIADLGSIGSTGSKRSEESQVKTGTGEEITEISQELANKFNVKTLGVEVDVTDNDAINRMMESVKKHFAGVDILCNNAGASFGVPSGFETYDEAAWMKTIDVNLHSVFKMSRAVLPVMGDGGAIINTASRAGKVPALFNGAYAVAKAGVIMLTKIMALELSGRGIRVNAICPGQIMTDLEKWRFGLEAGFFNTTVEEREKEMIKTIPLNRIGKTEEVGDLVAFLASGDSSYMTGQAINITGGQLMEL
jgi:NAD(P)-dependent dehydrogenase (short-subunit alcohol dehydrogenase family)